MKVITFSRYFPKGHPREGEPTRFVEKVLNSLTGNDLYWQKHHTIRKGKRWNVGDKFSARYWSDRPYRSKQVEFAEIEVKNIFDFEMDLNGVYSINGKYLLSEDEDVVEVLLAKNDGLDTADFFKWFMPNYKKPKEFKGQIICWNENISY